MKTKNCFSIGNIVKVTGYKGQGKVEAYINNDGIFQSDQVVVRLYDYDHVVKMFDVAIVTLAQ